MTLKEELLKGTTREQLVEALLYVDRCLTELQTLVRYGSLAQAFHWIKEYRSLQETKVDLLLKRSTHDEPKHI